MTLNMYFSNADTTKADTTKQPFETVFKIF